jgi:predicted pyridoxine 5'-phosphate oxidase superfamily flavin-nucleotide-binding protein
MTTKTFSPELRAFIENAPAKALATSGAFGLNVVPVSVVRVFDTELHCYDFFMQKTATHAKEGGIVAFTAWEGFAGVQVKGTVTYHDADHVFADGQAAMRERFPERTLRGVLVIAVEEIFNVSVGGERVASLLAEV